MASLSSLSLKPGVRLASLSSLSLKPGVRLASPSSLSLKPGVRLVSLSSLSLKPGVRLASLSSLSLKPGVRLASSAAPFFASLLFHSRNSSHPVNSAIWLSFVIFPTSPWSLCCIDVQTYGHGSITLLIYYCHII